MIFECCPYDKQGSVYLERTAHPKTRVTLKGCRRGIFEGEIVE